MSLDQTMSLDQSCLDYIGRRLYVETHASWGRSDTEILPFEPQRHEPPFSFRVRIVQLLCWPPKFHHGGRGIVGGLGIIEEPHHFLEGYLLNFRLRYYNLEGVNFTDNLGIYNLELRGNDTKLEGYGVIGETPE